MVTTGEDAERQTGSKMASEKVDNEHRILEDMV
jgi:hypothetical protein